MPTLADIKTRVQTEMVRSDLSTTLAAQLLLHIQQACEYYSNQKFWFNALVASTTTTSNQQDITIPAGFRIVERVTIPAYKTELREFILTGQDDYPVYSVPQIYSYYNDKLRLYPIPNATYTLNFYGIAQVDPPAVDGDSSIWTNEAFDLICAHTKMTLYRGQFRDADGFEMAKGEVGDFLTNLKRETAKRLETPLRPMPPIRKRYNIYID